MNTKIKQIDEWNCGIIAFINCIETINGKEEYYKKINKILHARSESIPYSDIMTTSTRYPIGWILSPNLPEVFDLDV